MLLPRALTAVLPTIAVIALILSAMNANSVDETTKKSTSHNQKTERLIFSPAKLGFGTIDAEGQKVQTVTMTNAGNSGITLLQAVASGNDFTLTGLEFPLTLASGESFTFSVVFAPRVPGESRGSISFISPMAHVSNRILTTGSATEGKQLTANPPAMNFGTISVGTAGNQAGQLIAGSKPVTVTSAISSDPQFTVSGLSFPFTIPAGGSKEFGVTFTPRTEGAALVRLSFTDASGTRAVFTESLNGVGETAHGHSVDLEWRASTSKNVVGYNIYRGVKPGGPYRKINSELDKATCYTDSSVVNGATYYYVSTAVNSHNRESAYSNLAEVKVP
jgi:hypothetical protein